MNKKEKKTEIKVTEEEKLLMAMFILKILDEQTYDLFKEGVMNNEGFTPSITRKGEKLLIKAAYKILEINKFKNSDRKLTADQTRYIG
jgi:hypothetical protein